jgi:transposase
MSVDANRDIETIETLRARVRELDTQCQTLRIEHGELAERAQSAEAQARSAQAQARSAQAQVHALQSRADHLAFQVKRLAYLLYGRRSEKLSRQALGQLALALGASEEEAAALEPCVPHSAAPTETVAPAQDFSPAPDRKRRKHPGRSRLAPALERVVTPVLVPEDQRACRRCGEDMVAFHVVEHERVEHVPEKLLVHVEQREVLGCRRCRGDAITAPRTGPSIVRRAGHSLLAALIENKCDDGLPIHRQQDRLARMGFDVPVNTLYGYFAHGTDLIVPVAAVTLSTLLGQFYAQVDDTTLKVLDKGHPRGRSLGHLWCFSGPGPLVGYTFTESWKAEQIAPFLDAIEGFIQCDDYKGYSSKVVSPDGTSRILVPPERRLGCLMHVRRRFYAALQLGDKRATEPIECIRELYAIEALAKERELDAAGRTALRFAHSIAWLDRFDAWVDAYAQTLPPRSKLAEAVGYALHQRPFIRRCFTDGRFELDNGKVERAIREPAIGRRNFLFTGSAEAARRLAAAYTLVQSCRALGISTRSYLIDVLDKLEAGWSLRRIGELVPDRWSRDRELLAPAQPTA